MPTPDQSERRFTPPSADMQDVRPLFSQLYNDHSLFINRARKIDEMHGEAEYVVQPYHCGPRPSLILRGDISIDGQTINNNVHTTNVHTEGHFRTDTDPENPEIVPAYMGSGMIFQALQHEKPLWITEISGGKFQTPVLPNEDVLAYATIIDQQGNKIVASGSVTRDDGQKHTLYEQILAEQTGFDDFGDSLAQHSLLEIGAQFGGAMVLMKEKTTPGKLVPVYLRIQEGIFAKELIHPEDVLSGTITVIRSDTYSAVVDVDISNKNTPIAKLKGLKFGMVPFEMIQRKIRERKLYLDRSI